MLLIKPKYMINIRKPIPPPRQHLHVYVVELLDTRGLAELVNSENSEFQMVFRLPYRFKYSWERARNWTGPHSDKEKGPIAQ